MDDEAEEINAEDVTLSYRELLLNSLGLCGWFLLFGAVILFVIYKRILQSKVQAIAEAEELKQCKKFDMSLQDGHEEAKRRAREALQKRYELDAAREKERQNLKKEKELRETAEKLGIKINEDPKICIKPVGVEDFVTNLIENHPVVVFSKSSCPYSRKAKQFLSTYRLSERVYQIIELDAYEQCFEIQDFLAKLTGARSVPRVFIGGKFFGGGEDTVTASRNGRLEKLLTKAGAFSDRGTCS